MLYYIDGTEVSLRKAKDYFFAGHEKTIAWFEKKGVPWRGDTAATLWADRSRPSTRDQIFSISGIQEHGGLEISDN